MTTEERRALAIAFCVAAVLAIGATVGFRVAVALSAASVQGESGSVSVFGSTIELPIVTKTVRRLAGVSSEPWNAFLDSQTVGRAFLALGFGLLIASALILRKRTWALVRAFFAARGSPRNLAIFRIVLFGFAAVMVGREQLMLFANLPPNFVVPPFGMEWLLSRVPISGTTTGVAHWLFVATSLAAAVGVATRLTSGLALVLGIWVLGIPNFFGKVDHYNHVLWFMAILSVSPSGDTLSVDALIRSWRNPRSAELPEPSVRYALPLRFVWLLIGICYLFPGFWKIADGGLAWMWGDTFKYILQRRWGDPMLSFNPVFRLDQYPVFYRFAATAAVAFELSFVWLILSSRLRPLAVAAGLAFHNTTGLMMGIWFLHMQICYVSFIDWNRLLGAFGQKAFPQMGSLQFDPNDIAAARFAAMARHLDLLQRTQFVPVSGEGDAEPLSTLRHATDRTEKRGWSAVLSTLGRIPLAALLVPAVLIAGRMRASDPTTPTVRTRLTATRDSTTVRPRGASTWPVWTVGIVLIAANSAVGVLDIEAGWPFAAYPTFARISDPYVRVLTVTAVNPNGNRETLDFSPAVQAFGYPKFGPLVRQIARTEEPAVRAEMLAVLYDVAVQETADPPPARLVRFEYSEVSTDPGGYPEPTFPTQVLAELWMDASDAIDRPSFDDLEGP